MDNEYPLKALSGIIEQNQKQDGDIVYTFPPSITEVIDRVSILANTIQNSLAIQMIITKNEIIIQSQRESGKIKETIKLDKPLEQFEDVQKIEMWVEPDFIIEASKKVTGFIVREYTDNNGTQKNLLFFNDKYCQVVAAYLV